MLYLLRLPEIGKEPHPEKSKARRDVASMLGALLPSPTLRFDVGRIFVETEVDAISVLGTIHGIQSFSPCERVTLAALDEAFVRMAGPLVGGGSSFAVKVKRVGEHPFRSPEKARQLGALVLSAYSASRVDLASPERTLQVEIRGDDCYLFSEVITGCDHEPKAERPVAAARFVVDHMLGTLATRLRILGFDTSFYRDTSDSFLHRKAEEEGRFLLTQDRELSRLGGTLAYLVQARELHEQVAEVLSRYRLTVSPEAIFSRCTRCNEALVAADRGGCRGRIPEKVYEEGLELWRCPSCDKFYWKGSHVEKLLESLGEVAPQVTSGR